jgi:hypothetical protein
VVVTLAMLLVLFSAVAVALALPAALSDRRDAYRTIAQVVLGIGLSAIVLLGLAIWWFLSQIHIG